MNTPEQIHKQIVAYANIIPTSATLNVFKEFDGMLNNYTIMHKQLSNEQLTLGLLWTERNLAVITRLHAKHILDDNVLEEALKDYRSAVGYFNAKLFVMQSMKDEPLQDSSKLYMAHITDTPASTPVVPRPSSKRQASSTSTPSSSSKTKQQRIDTPFRPPVMYTSPSPGTEDVILEEPNYGWHSRASDHARQTRHNARSHANPATKFTHVMVSWLAGILTKSSWSQYFHTRILATMEELKRRKENNDLYDVEVDLDEQNVDAVMTEMAKRLASPRSQTPTASSQRLAQLRGYQSEDDDEVPHESSQSSVPSSQQSGMSLMLTAAQAVDETALFSDVKPRNNNRLRSA